MKVGTSAENCGEVGAIAKEAESRSTESERHVEEAV
jgi:hypothetical protein